MTSKLARTAELVFEQRRNLHSALTVSAAEAADEASVEWITRRLAIISLADGRRFLIDGPIALESSVGSAVVDNKQLTREFLTGAGVPTPFGEVAQDVDDAVRIAQRFARSVVVKPLSGSEGKGVTVDLSEEDEIRAAFHRADHFGKGVLVEEYIDIEEEYRCMATPTGCLSVIKRVLPAVTGDAQHTVEELIDEKNRQRSENPALFRLPIPKDDVVKIVLARQGLTRESIPPAGESVLIRNVGGLTGGGEPHECTETVDAAVRDIAFRAVAAVPGLGWAGVDVVTEKGTGRVFVLEINVNAGYGGVTFPVEGEARNVAATVWDVWRDRTAADRQVDARVPDLAAPPRRLSEIFPRGWNAHSTKKFGEVFVDHLREQAGEVSVFGNTVMLFTPGGKDPRWLTTSAGGSQDLLGPRRTARSHGKVRRFLAAAGVPRPRGRRITTQEGLNSVFEASSGPFIAIPDGEDWGGRRRRLLREPALPTPWNGAWFVQRRLPGTRLRMYCTRDAAWAVTSADDSVDGPSPAELERAVELSLRAVRALPGLRWAAVDAVLWRAPAADSADRTVLVEGLTIHPRLQSDEMLVAGDLRGLFDWIAGIEPTRRSLGRALTGWLSRRRG